MQPYYSAQGIEIWHGDCRDVLPRLILDEYAVITDPPYKTRASGVPIGDRLGGGNLAPITVETTSVGMPWGYSIDWIDLLNPLHWVVYCNYQMLGDVCSKLERQSIMSCVFTWRKSNAPQMTRPVPRLDCEFAVWTRAEHATCARMGEFKSMVIDVPLPQAGALATERFIERDSGKAAHPTQKPLAVVLPFVDRLDMSLIVDPFMGTGTTIEAAKRLGRKAIGIEIEERYCEIAARRLSQEVMDLSL